LQIIFAWLKNPVKQFKKRRASYFRKIFSSLTQIGGRVEGAENALHSLLGPEGFLKNNRMSDLFRSEAGDDDDEGGEDEEEEDGDDEINAPARTPRSSSNARLRDIKQQVTGRGKQT